MTNSTNNNELVDILLQYSAELNHGLNELAGHGTALEQATKAIEDFYRNKILEARNETLDALENHKKTLDYIVKDGAPRNPTNYEVYLRKAIEVDGKIDEITAQFNKGESDEYTIE